MNNQKDYTIAEFYTLPSEGKVYGELIDPQVELRSMTTAEEMRRLAPSENSYENLCSIIDDCLVKGPKMSSYDMCLGDYQFLLYKLRIVTYGAEYSVNSKCPYCRSTNTEKFNLEDLIVRTYTDDIEKYKSFELPVTKHSVSLRMVTPRILDSLQRKVKEFTRKSSDESMNSAILYTISSVIDTLDGKKLNEAKLEEFIRTLPMGDTNTISNYSEKLSSMIGIDTDITFKCRFCGSLHKSKLAITDQFFRPSLDI